MGNTGSGALAIAKTLKKLGVEVVYLFPGGTIAPLLDCLVKEGINYITARNEQGAGYAAIGAAKISGKPQVVMVTSGPGATNLLTCIADAYYDSIPIFAITGQVGTKDINYSGKTRQTGFQETKTVDIFKPVTKKAVLIDNSQNLEKQVKELFELTSTGRPGPVLIDLPMDIQRSIVNTENTGDSSITQQSQPETAHQLITNDQIWLIKEKLASAKRPLILLGNGIHIACAEQEIKTLVNILNIPAVSSLPGLGSIASDHPLHYSFIGHTGEYYANLALYHSDVVLVLGARLDLRQTGTDLSQFNDEKLIIRVDIDTSELEFGRVHGQINVMADLKTSLSLMIKQVAGFYNHNLVSWIERIQAWKVQYDSKQFYEKMSLSSYHVLRAVDNFTRNNRVIVSSGVGTHQQLVARYFTFKHPDRIWMTSAGHGTMGFDVPTNIGAIMKDSSYDYGLVFVGDGSFQMNIQELATIANYNLPIKIFVLDNNRLGIVSQFQLMNWDKDESTGNKINPSFSKIATGYGISGWDIYKKEEIPTILDKVFSTNSPSVVHCHIDMSEDVLPMLLAGQKMNEMYPFSEPK